MAEFKLGRIKFVWKDNWVTGTTYYKDDIVAYGGKTYICVVGHAASADFYTDLENVPTRWNQFSDGQDWKGNWATTTLYKENDIVKYGGYLYICNNGHTSSTTLETNQSDWDLIAESFDWKGNWVATTVYKVNDLVKYGGYVYLCNHAHTAAATDTLGLENNSSYWDIFSKGTDWKGAWTTSSRYKVGDVVKYGGTTYVCNTGHTSASTAASGLEASQSNWDYFNQGIEFKGAWTSGVRYKANDIVKAGGGTYICILNHTSSNFVSDNSNWNQFVEGVEFEGTWVTGTQYQPGDIVRYGGNTYIAKIALNAGSPPPQDTGSYDLFTTGFNLRGDWDSATTYKIGEIVRLGGYTYVATADSTNHIPPNASYWSKLNEGINWEGDWVAARTYNLGDSVKYGPNSYICVAAHSSSTGLDRPDNDITGAYWNLLTAGNEESVLTTTGDLVYYSGSGPTRLPIGDEGQVLSVSEGLPTWKYFGEIKNVWYVAPHGTNSPAPTYGKTIDKPWASLRYACEQIEKGTEYPQAGYLLKMNRTFIQREIAEWVKYQIAHPTGIWTSFANDNDALCERDMGLIVDAIIYDLTHTGNVKTREATESYFNAAGTALIAAISDEEEQLVAAINYGVTVIGSVLANTAPAASYQTLNSVASKTKQIIDTDYTAESGAATTCADLATIITDAVTAGTTANMPVEDLPNYTINLKTGQYYEVLPIHVPANTAIVGDELHSSRVSPQVKVIATNDKAKSVATLQRIQSVIDDIITNSTVTATTGNTETQDKTSQRPGTGTDSGATLSIDNVLEMKKIIQNGISSASAFVYPNPTGYNTSYLAGYGDARAQLVANKDFIVDEITEWIADQIAGPIAPFSGSFTYDSAACERDVGYIIDALVYDLTYGGNLQTVIAARSYLSLGSAVYGAGEKDEVLAAYAHLKDVVNYVIAENTGWSKATALTQNTSGTAGSAGSNTFAQARIQEIYDTINLEYIPGAKQSTFADLQAAKSAIAGSTTAYVTSTYPELVYDKGTCSRDIELIIDAVCYDIVTGSNFASSVAGAAYYRIQSATVTGSQLTETLAAVTYAQTLSLPYVDLSLQATVEAAFDNVLNILENGLGVVPTYNWPDNGTSTSTTVSDAALLQTNRATMITGIETYLSTTVPYDAVWAALTTDQKNTCKRDVGYIIDAVTYDLQYSGTYQSVIAGAAYYSFGTLEIAGGEKAATLAAVTQLATLMKAYTSAGGDTTVDTLTTVIYNIINTGTIPTSTYPSIAGELAVTAPSTSWVSSALATAGAKLLAAKPYIQTEAVEFINRKYPDLVYNEALCKRDVGYIVEALAYDAMFGSNYMSIKAGMSYKRSLTSTGVVTSAQLQPTLAIVDFVFSKAQTEFRNSTAIASILNNTREMKEILLNGAGNANAFVRPTPTSGSYGYTSNYFNAARLILANKEFLKAEAIAFVNYTYPSLDYNTAACARDIGYIAEALAYDLTYGGNLATVIAARSYYTNGVLVEPTGEKTAALATQTRIKDIIDNIASGSAVTPTTGNTVTQDTSGTAGGGTALTFAQARVQEIYDTINTGTSPTVIAPDTSWVSSDLLAARAKLVAAVTTIQTDAVTYVNREFPALNFNETTCSRDVGYIVDALGYDMMFGSNFLSIWNGMSYRRALTSTGTVLAEQSDATASIIDFIGAKASKIAAVSNVDIANAIFGDIISYVNSGSAPIVVGTNLPTTDLTMIDSAEIILLNKEFLAAEAAAYIADTFKTTVTASTGGATDTFTCSSTSWMSVGDMVRFTGTVFGDVALNTTYYVSAIVDSTTFQISDDLGGATFSLSSATGTMTVRYYYDVVACQNDIRHYVDALAADMMYTGNYNGIRAAQYYRSALTGSKLENMFLVRNGCGIRNITLTGLDGTSDGNTAGAGDADGLGSANEFGTKRPLAGAYVSLDPGWGPNDYRVWVTTRSTYVQNVTTFGTSCIGQKIDGSVHAGGVDSIVSNDFTQVLSNGIGAWVTNLGRAELVSVFTYYNYIGYLAENGGKIRATNGNNSYGTYGSIAEGIDVTETPVLGQINNRAHNATVRNVITDGNQVLTYEFGNAGSEYSSATFTTSGAGAGVATVANEFRDGAVFEVRLTDPGDSSGTGGTGYITASNQAQAGDTSHITLAAADTQSSAAYVGMEVLITSGTGAGQFGYIQAYNSGSKIATVYKPSTGTAGWDHVVPGTAIESALDVTTAYQITPRLTIAAPAFTKTLANDLPANAVWTDVAYGDGYGSYTNLSATGGSGSLATFDVTRREGVYTVEVNIPGALYTAGNTLTILGTSLGGTSPANDLTITVNTVSSPSGAVTAVTASGTAVTAKYVAVASGTTSAAYSLDGLTWTAMTMPTATGPGGGEANNQWSAIAYGVVSNVGYYVAVARASAVAAYSKDGINWTSSNLTEVADWCDIAYGNGSFVAIAESDSASAFRAVSTNGGATWATTSLANGAKAIAYGGTRFVEIEGNFSNSVGYSASGVAWTVTTLPANDDSTESNWVDIAYGNGRFVAISDSSAMAAYSFNGATWYKSNLPGIYEWTSIGYGQGVFYVTSKGDQAATSPDGVTWTLRSSSTASLNVTATSKDYISSTYTESSALTSGTWTDVIYDGTKFVAVGYTGAAGLYATSTNGTSWTNGALPTVSGTYEYTAVAYNGTDKYVALVGGNTGTRNIAYSSNATSWTGQVSALSNNAYWKDLVWAGDRFVAMRGDSAAINHSTDGVTWTVATVTGGSSEMSALAYGSISGTSYLVAVSGYSTGSQTVSYSTNNGVTWTSGSSMPSSSYWADVTYGNSKFVAVAGGTTAATTKAAYSTNGTSWTAATMPGAAAYWNKVVYGGGAYIAFAYNSTRTAYSADGITWVEGPAQTTSRNWATAAYGSIKAVSLATGTTYASYANLVLDTNYLTTSSTTDLRVGDRIRLTGAVVGGLVSGASYYITSVYSATQFTISTTRGGSNVVLSTGSGTMPFVAGRDFSASCLGNYNGTPRWVVIAEGSASVQNIRQGATARARAYVSDNKITEIWISEPGSGYTSAPTLTITDPNNTGSDATTSVRIGNGAIAQPMFTNRGSNYTAASAEITGNGYGDSYQVTTYVSFMNLDGIPKAGSNVQIAGINDVWYRLVNVTNLLPNDDGTYNAQLQLSPAIGAAEAPEHGAATIARRRYSQVRLTGHDLLDIGTGDYITSNYPGLPLTDPVPAQEYKTANGGRVFYTSTDQDGNFRVGGLFNVEQSTGVATLNADAFNIAGLNQLSLGSVALGGTGATITEFSTDPFFTADSDNIVPTQRAIKAYITSQIGGGGSSLNVNTLTAGVVYIAGQTIATTTNVQIDINTKVNFKGGIVGDALVMNYFLLNN